MPNSQEIKLIHQATEIFLRLRDDPKNTGLQEDRDRFLARGEAERAAYKKMLQAWQLTDPGEKKPGPRKTLILLAALFAASSYAVYQPLRVALLADAATRYDTAKAQLVSGDTVTLDAASAIDDNTDDHTRAVTLLRGAAFFEVQTDGRPFVVSTGGIRVEVTGTSFEVGQLDDGVVVTVTEGSVEASRDDQIWRLAAGERLIWSNEAGAQVSEIDADSAALWREDLLVSRDMTLAQILEVLERRVPGVINVLSKATGQRRVVGTFDLSDPSGTLELIAIATDIRIIKVSPFITLVTPKSN